MDPLLSAFIGGGITLVGSIITLIIANKIQYRNWMKQFEKEKEFWRNKFQFETKKEYIIDFVKYIVDGLNKSLKSMDNEVDFISIEKESLVRKNFELASNQLYLLRLFFKDKEAEELENNISILINEVVSFHNLVEESWKIIHSKKEYPEKEKIDEAILESNKKRKDCMKNIYQILKNHL